MRRFPRMLPVLLNALIAGNASWAAAPFEREVVRHAEVRAYGAAPLPIGAIDFSSSANGARRIGPWDLKTDGLEDSGQLRFHDDGSVGGTGTIRQERWAPAAGRTCTSHGNLTVCR